MCVLHKTHATKGQNSQRITLLCISYLTKNENHADIVPFKDSEMLWTCCTSKESPNAVSVSDSPASSWGTSFPFGQCWQQHRFALLTKNFPGMSDVLQSLVCKLQLTEHAGSSRDETMALHDTSLTTSSRLVYFLNTWTLPTSFTLSCMLQGTGSVILHDNKFHSWGNPLWLDHG